MKARIKHKLSNEWFYCHTLIFELYDNALYIYQDEEALHQKEIIGDCTLEIEVRGKLKQYNVRDGCIQKL